MALQILENKGSFYIKGNIISKNVEALKNHFKYVLKRKNNIVINIDKVTEIDTSGVLAFTELHKKAQQMRVKFTITGIGCKDIYNHFENQSIA